MRNLVLILILSINNICCNNPDKKTSVSKILQPLEIDNYKNKMVIKRNQNDLIYHFKLRGYDLGDSRYVSSVDEKDENIKALYKKFRLNNFNSDKSFKSIKKDTVYTFPLSEQSPDKLFNKDYSENVLHIFYLTAYRDNKYGQVIIIDSIR